MLKQIKEFLRGDTSLDINSPDVAAQREASVATAVLLLEMAGTDSDYAPEETRAIFQIMKHEFHLEENAVLELLEIADTARHQAGKIDEFVKLVNTNFSSDQRVRILAMAYRVILADKKLEKTELRFLTQLKFRLQLSDEQMAQARTLAQTST